MERVRSVWLDCDGTLYRIDEYLEAHRDNAIYGEISTRTGRRVEDIAKEYPVKLKEFKSNTNTLKSYGFTESEARDVYNSFNIIEHIEKKNDDLVMMIESILNQNITVNIFTNNKRSVLLDIMKKLELHTDLFSNLMTAEEVAPKPSTEGYKKIIARSECSPNEIIYVGDRHDAEIVPAQKEGLNTVLVWSENPSSVKFDQGNLTYHFQKKTIYEVTSVIAELSDLVRERNKDQ